MTERGDKAELFNEFFASVFLDTDQGKSLNWLTDRHRSDTSPPNVSADLVKGHLERLDVFRSAGPDERHPRVLEELASAIAEPLWHGCLSTCGASVRSQRTGKGPVWSLFSRRRGRRI